MTSRTEPPGALVVHARHDRPRPGPRPAAAASRGPGQADRRRDVRRRPRRPGRLVRRDDPLDRRARAVRRDRARPGVRLVDGRRRHRRRHPRRQHRQLDQGRPADPRPGRRRDPAPRRAARPARRARPGDAAGGPRTRSRSGPSRSRRSSTRSRPTTSSPRYDIETGDVDAAFAAADLVLEGEYRVGHQEQLYIENNAMIAVPARRRRGRRHTARSSARTTSTRRSSAASRSTTGRRGSIQAETGGGFGGKEEYPSMIALHAALLALQGRPAGPDDLRPPRGHRRHDEAPPGDRPAPDRRDRATAGSSPRTSRSSWTAARTAR